jgi:hypothetical protein
MHFFSGYKYALKFLQKEKYELKLLFFIESMYLKVNGEPMPFYFSFDITRKNKYCSTEKTTQSIFGRYEYITL